MKALVILKSQSKKLGGRCGELNEAISALEEFIKPNECSTCKYYDGSHSCFNENSIAYKFVSRLYPDDGCLQGYEPKEKE